MSRALCRYRERADCIDRLLARYGLGVSPVHPGAPVPGSYWGAPEAGLIGATLFARPDTPLHSVLHEAGHFVCMDPQRRAGLDTDAGGDDAEENAVCYLQILLADHLPRVGRSRMCADMDAWGYSFRLGSAARWFAEDARDARGTLLAWGLIDDEGRPTFRVRGGDFVE